MQNRKIRAMGWGLVMLFGAALAGRAAETAPRRILVVGDSIMQLVARSIEREMTGREGVVVSSYTSIGSGLARLDQFDWHAQFKSLVADFRPDTVVVMMGANDNQPMKTPGGIVRVGSPEWAAEYGRRVGQAMDQMIEAGVSRVIWLELPDMREGRLQKDVQMINGLVAKQAEAREKAFFQTTRAWLSRTPGTFSPYVLQATGMPLEIRNRDGIHLNRAGADLLAAKLTPVLLPAPAGE